MSAESGAESARTRAIKPQASAGAANHRLITVVYKNRKSLVELLIAVPAAINVDAYVHDISERMIFCLF